VRHNDWRNGLSPRCAGWVRAFVWAFGLIVCSGSAFAQITLPGAGNINTVAGVGTSIGDNGAATSAQLNTPFGVVLDPAGNSTSRTLTTIASVKLQYRAASSSLWLEMELVVPPETAGWRRARNSIPHQGWLSTQRVTCTLPTPATIGCGRSRSQPGLLQPWPAMV
jgi:hypothetical protein